MVYIWKKNRVTYTFWQKDDANPPSAGIYSGPSVIFAGNQSGQTSGPLYYAPSAWHTIDLKPLGVAADAQSCVIAGHLVITESSVNAIDDLVVCMRPPGSTMAWQNYQLQAMAALNGDGARGNQRARVSLVNGCFELFWQGSTAGVASNGPTGFLVNLWLEEWNMDEAVAPPPPPPPPPPPDPDPPTVIYVPAGGITIRFEQE